jgi:hypothetical protein
MEENIQDINYIDENINSFLKKNRKNENHIFNTIREKIIELFLKYYPIDIQFKKESSNQIYNEFRNTIHEFGIHKIIEYRHIGGRNNKDFYLRYLNKENQVIEIDLEFKSGTLSIDKLPQFLQLYTSNRTTRLFDYEYHEFFYKKYLPILIKEILNNHTKDTLPSISKIPLYHDYLKSLNLISKYTFQYRLYLYYKIYKPLFNKIVKRSISDYLHQHQSSLHIDSFNKKLSEQKNKIYLFTHHGNFKIDQIQNYMNVIKLKEIKNNNTLIFETKNNGEIHCLLRWKNGNGCRGPAWQISFKRPS